MFQNYEYCVAFGTGVINWFKQNKESMGNEGFMYAGKDEFPLLIPEDFEGAHDPKELI